jgi:uncharacterized protein YyaL (SSP411 family)
MSDHQASASNQPPAHPANRLARETSPYLLQHAHNPVDWYPWGPEAVEAARRRDVPIFVSIGYSTCYWCHVMERESFENHEIARLMNERFVCVKVDREERPDVDDIYMAATVMMSGRGGWPMTVFLEPTSLKPFWCGTYFPPTARPDLGIASLPQVIEAMSQAWTGRRDEVLAQAEQVGAAVTEQLSAPAESKELGPAEVQGAVEALIRMFDRTNGGFGGAPKFPQPVFLDFLIEVRARAADDATADAIDIALRKTLDRMAIGGLRDHVGGGFHRYSVDHLWLVPHFEKMLYDNAQLIATYARAARHYGDSLYSDVVRSIASYVAAEMTDAGGGFYSAQDAEVDGREGLNYLWTVEEMRAALPDPQDADLAIRAFGLDQGPNFRDPHHPTEPARNVLRLAERPEKLANHLQRAPETFRAELRHLCELLYAARSRRPSPRLDDKVLASWNGLMIAGLAVAARELDDASLLEPARRAADFVLAHMVETDGAVRRSWRKGVSGRRGVLEDSAMFMHGLLELAKASAAADRDQRIAQTLRVLAAARRDFFDESSGRFFDTRAGESDLFVRTMSTHDGALPSAVSVMLHNLIDLHELTGDDAHLQFALRCIAAMSGPIAEGPVGSINSTRALFRLLASRGGAESFAPPREKPKQTPESGWTPVEIYANVERASVTPDAPALVELVMKIAPGYHVVAADPGEGAPTLMPFRVDVTGGSGIAAYADYPSGEPFGVEGQGRFLAYTDTIHLRIALEATGPVTGRPLLTARFQACSDRECLRPTLVELDIAIDS